MSTDMVTVVLAADNEYAMPLTVAARSVIATLDPARRLRICVLDMGIDEDNRRTVELSLQHPRVEVLWVDTLHDRVAHFPNTWPKITRAGYARIYVPEVLSEVDRALYLDCDVVVRRDVAALSECEMGGNLAMGVQDVQAPFVPFGVPQWFEAGRSAGEVNFNSGVLLMDLGAWRRERVTQELVDYLTGARYLRAQDQEGINAVIGSRIGSLDPRWNQQAEIFWEGLRYHYEAFLPCDRDALLLVRKDPWIIHFSSHPKPWHYGCSHPFLEEWFASLDRTGFAGWRPRGPSQTEMLVRKWGGRLKRQARRLASSV